MSRKICHHEKQVAEFLFHLRRCQPLARFHQFGGLFRDLCHHLVGRGPVEPDPRRPLLQLHRPRQCGQPQRHPVQHPRRAALGGLDPLPIRRLLRGALVAAFLAEDMRMARHHLVGNRPHHIGKAEQARLFGHLRVIDGLQQQIAQFPRQLRPGLPRDHIGHLMRLLDRIGRDGGEILRDIPGAAGDRIAQPPHDLQQPRDLAAALHDQLVACRCVTVGLGHCGHLRIRI